MPNQRVVIEISGGCAEVAEVPIGVDVHILDYDTNGEPDSELCICSLGNMPHFHKSTEDADPDASGEE